MKVTNLTPARPALTPWNCLFADAVVWSVLVFLLIAFRGCLLWAFRVQLSAESGMKAVARCFGTGIHFDIQTATFALIPSLLMTLTAFFVSLGVWHSRVRKATVIFSMIACVFAFVTDLAYFAEYNQLHALGWWRVMRGDLFRPGQSQSK